MHNKIKKIILLLFLMINNLCFGQISVGSKQNTQPVLESMLFDSSMNALEVAIKDSSRRHAIYSYNIANATTPEFRPLLLPEDQSEIYKIAPPGVAKTYFNKVLLEHQTAKLAKNRSRQSAYYALIRKKADNYRQVLSLGKK
tara:strand:- start:668 stop:1093 length:426 start_codon:yes stop_codon:yes gene_type:complete